MTNTIISWTKKRFAGNAAIGGRRRIRAKATPSIALVAALNVIESLDTEMKFVFRITATSMRRIIRWNRVSCYYREYGNVVTKIV